MRVLQISNGIYPLSQAGTEIYTADLARSLSDSGVKLAVAIPGTARAMDMARGGGLPHYVRPIEMAPAGRMGNKLRYLTGRGPLWQQRIAELAADFEPDVIHVHHAEGFGISALDVVAETGRPLVITLPDYWLLCPGILRHCQGNVDRCARDCCASLRLGKLRGKQYVLARRKRIKRFVEHVRPTLAAISDSTRRIFEQEGFPADLLVTHTWSIDADKLRAQVNGHPAGFSPPRIAYIGTMRSHKGCHVLLEGFTKLKVNASLHFYGGGDEQYIRGLQENSRGLDVHFYGRFDHDSIGQILANVDVVAIPSIWDETYCLVAQEAMAARRPVVASRIGGMADRIVDGVNGFLVSPGDAEELAATMSRILPKLPEVIEGLDFDRCARSMEADASEWIELYQRTIARWPRRH